MRQIFNWYDELPDIDKVIILVGLLAATLGMTEFKVAVLERRVRRLERDNNG